MGLMGLANVLAVGMGLSNVPMCLGNGTSQCAQGMRLSNVPWEWD